MKGLTKSGKLYLGNGMVHVPADYSTWAKRKPLDTYLDTLGTATVHKSMSKSVAPQLQRVLDPEQRSGNLRHSACLES